MKLFTEKFNLNQRLVTSGDITCTENT